MLETQLSREEIRLLSRTAHALMVTSDGDKNEAQRFLECAAAAGDAVSQLSLGLCLARMDIDGQRNPSIEGIANYKEAIRWLSLAAAQGNGKAWFVISKIYQKAEFSQRSISQAHHYLDKAAQSGYHVAQRELGLLIWRTRKGDVTADVRAVFWLQKAAEQGCTESEAMLNRLGSRATTATWARLAQRQLAHKTFKVPHIMVARLTVAARFGLSIPEALLIDLRESYVGHCIVVDIRRHYARGKRRLILLNTEDERREMERIIRSLDDLDCGADGAEGQYRQRLYRLKKLLPNWEEVREAGRLFSGS